MAHTFSAVNYAVSLMSSFAYPWLIAGGWTIDLYLGRVTRAHKDVDVTVFRPDQLHLQRHFAGWHMYVAHEGQLYPWREGDYLQPPMHGLWVYRPSHSPPHTADTQPELEFLLDELSPSGDEWRFRHDLSIARPLDQAILRTQDGIPYLAPEIALLYKSRGHRAEDDTDFNNIRGVLAEERRRWLVRALEVCQPGHEWLGKL